MVRASAPRRRPEGAAARYSIAPLWTVTAVVILPAVVGAATWTIGDRDQPWSLYPVSLLLDAGETFKADYMWGGGHSVEVVVDDDGDGLLDEDPADRVDDDGDGLCNEDPSDGRDNDADGFVDEDGPDPQFDNDGDGLLNEDGLNTGGLIYDTSLSALYVESPFFRYATAEAAAADPGGSGYGWGDDDADGRFNEDLNDGRDNDRDGLVDEDGPGPGLALPANWTRVTFAYEGSALTVGQRQALAFSWDASSGRYVAEAGDGTTYTASPRNQRFTPADYLRPIRLDSQRNLLRLLDDRFLSGIYGRRDPFNATPFGSDLSTQRQGDAGYGAILDGNIFTAREVATNTAAAGFRAELFGNHWVDLIRLRPRPGFPDRTPTGFTIRYAGALDRFYRRTLLNGEVLTRLNVSEFIIPQQQGATRPAIKEYLFGPESELGESRLVQILDFRSAQPSGEQWELAEFEVYGHGYADSASYVTEVIDVGQPRGAQVRRYFDPAEPSRPITFESVQTSDRDRNESITTDELGSTILAQQFDPDAPGSLVTWGRVRWSGTREGPKGNVLIRVRAGTSADTHIYQRKVGGGVYSPFIADPIIFDWPQRGARVTAASYVALSSLDRAAAKTLPRNVPGELDGMAGGWTPWSAPFNFDDALVDARGRGGLSLPLPALARYVQFRLDFQSFEDSGVSIDWLEFDYGPPVVGRGVVAEIYPREPVELGKAVAFEYVLNPTFQLADAGFNRIDISTPSPDALVEQLLVDDEEWQSVGEAPAQVAGQAAARAWLDTVSLRGATTYAAAAYLDTVSRQHKLGIKTRRFTVADFPRGLNREIQINLKSAVFQLLTEFSSWVWDDRAAGAIQQPTEPGNAADRLPLDHVRVTAESSASTVALRSVSPNPFTPNGDLVNDEIRFDLDLYLLIDEKQVTLSVYDLGGRRVATATPDVARAGATRVSWDGVGDDGRLVAPGIYLYRLEVDSDTDERKSLTGSLAVAY